MEGWVASKGREETQQLLRRFWVERHVNAKTFPVLVIIHRLGGVKVAQEGLRWDWVLEDLVSANVKELAQGSRHCVNGVLRVLVIQPCLDVVDVLGHGIGEKGKVATEYSACDAGSSTGFREEDVKGWRGQVGDASQGRVEMGVGQLGEVVAMPAEEISLSCQSTGA